MTDIEPRTAAATAAVIRRGQETKAAALRDAGWLVVPPERVRYWTEIEPTLAQDYHQAGSGMDVGSHVHVDLTKQRGQE